MAILGISTAEVDALVAEPKLISANVVWHPDVNGHKLEARVLVLSSSQLLRLTGKLGERNYSFCLLLNNFPIRRWCTKRRHTNPDKEIIRGPHKHRFDEEHGDNWAYQPNDLTPIDVNLDFAAFLEECNISLTGMYQAIAL